MPKATDDKTEPADAQETPDETPSDDDDDADIEIVAIVVEEDDEEADAEDDDEDEDEDEEEEVAPVAAAPAPVPVVAPISRPQPGRPPSAREEPPPPFATGERVILTSNTRPRTGTPIGDYPVGSTGRVETVLSQTAIVRFDIAPDTKEVVAFTCLKTAETPERAAELLRAMLEPRPTAPERARAAAQQAVDGKDGASRGQGPAAVSPRPPPRVVPAPPPATVPRAAAPVPPAPARRPAVAPVTPAPASRSAAPEAKRAAPPKA